MSISPVSNINALFGVQPPQNQSVPKKPGSTQTPTDTVELSAAAQQHLQSQGVDKDGDGDGH